MGKIGESAVLEGRLSGGEDGTPGHHSTTCHIAYRVVGGCQDWYDGWTAYTYLRNQREVPVSRPSGFDSESISPIGAVWRGASEAFRIETPLPRFRRVRLDFPRPKVADLPAAVFSAMDSVEGSARLGNGKRVAITAGSRGINRISEVLAAVVRRVREYGGDPFIVPAMGSHGRAIAEGQV